MDDDEIVRRVLLAIAGTFADPVAVKGAALALLYLQANAFDVVLSDTELGTGPTGLWLLAEVARRWPHVRRCLMSSTPQTTADDFFRKPLDRDALLRVVHGPASRR